MLKRPCFIQVTNVASQCGYTESNYKGLQKLYEKFHDSGFEVIPPRGLQSFFPKNKPVLGEKSSRCSLMYKMSFLSTRHVIVQHLSYNFVCGEKRQLICHTNIFKQPQPIQAVSRILSGETVYACVFQRLDFRISSLACRDFLQLQSICMFELVFRLFVACVRLVLSGSFAPI